MQRHQIIALMISILGASLGVWTTIRWLVGRNDMYEAMRGMLDEAFQRSPMGRPGGRVLRSEESVAGRQAVTYVISSATEPHTLVRIRLFDDERNEGVAWVSVTTEMGIEIQPPTRYTRDELGTLLRNYGLRALRERSRDGRAVA